MKSGLSRIIVLWLDVEKGRDTTQVKSMSSIIGLWLDVEKGRDTTRAIL